MGNKAPHSPQVPLIEHADIRRMLLTMKAYVEGGLSLALQGARLVDEKKVAQTDEEREMAAGLLDLLCLADNLHRLLRGVAHHVAKGNLRLFLCLGFARSALKAAGGPIGGIDQRG